MAPVEAFERMKAVPGEDGTLKPGYEAAPLRTVDPIRAHERKPHGADHRIPVTKATSSVMSWIRK